MNTIQILFVDDEDILRRATKAYMEDVFDFFVDTASNGEEALKMLDERKYDAVLSDYEMPVLDGIGLLKQIRENQSKIPFIIFTGRGREEVAMEALNCGADFYMQKGGDPSSLYDLLAYKIKKAVEFRRGEEEKYELLNDLEELIGACPNSAAIINPDFSIRFMNEKGKKEINDYYDYSGDFHGKKLYEIFPEDIAEEERNQYLKALNERNQMFFLKEVKDELFEIHISPHFDHDGNLRFYSYFQQKKYKNN